MINMEFFKKQIEGMDVKSDEFYDLYTFICDKYYTFPNPDDFQKAVITLRMYLDKSCSNYEDQVIVISHLVSELFKISKDKKGGACLGTLGFKNKDYHYTLTTDKKHIEEITKVMGKIIKGDFNVKNKDA